MAIENLEVVESALGLESGKLAEMISSEDKHTLDIENVVIENKEDYNTKLGNHKKQWQRDAVEVAIKNARNKHELDFQGKTMENLIEALVKKTESNAVKDPNERYDNLKTDFEKAQGLIADWEGKYNQLESTYKAKEEQRGIENKLLKSIPENTAIDREDILAILKAKYEFSNSEDGFAIIPQGEGKPLQDKNLNLLGVNDFMSEFIKPYLKPVEGGAGGGDSSASGGSDSLEAFDKRMQTKGVNVGSEQYNEEMMKAISDGTLKM